MKANVIEENSKAVIIFIGIQIFVKLAPQNLLDISKSKYNTWKTFYNHF